MANAAARFLTRRLLGQVVEAPLKPPSLHQKGHVPLAAYEARPEGPALKLHANLCAGACVGAEVSEDLLKIARRIVIELFRDQGVHKPCGKCVPFVVQQLGALEMALLDPVPQSHSFAYRRVAAQAHNGIAFLSWRDAVSSRQKFKIERKCKAQKIAQRKKGRMFDRDPWPRRAKLMAQRPAVAACPAALA